MPQSAYAATIATKSGKQSSALLDAVGALLIGQGSTVTKNITASTLLRAAGPGRICKISVIVAGSAAGTVNDCATTGAAAVANQIAAIPAAVGLIALDMPCTLGMVIVPGTGQTLAVSFQ